ncbi:MAG: sugar-transfer associated ATP-grasp domain-containing protein [Bacteroidales bacterium]|nr:sugar-transfer associated ATP-grasp domain-containing protein [Bacteroidales bacterium]
MSLLKYWEALGVWGTRKSRQKDSDLELKQKKMFTPLTAKEIQNIKNLWGGIKLNYKYFELYKTGHDEVDSRYIPDDLYYTIVDPYFNKPIDCRYIDDKNLYDLLFSDVNQPKTVARKENGQFISASYELITEKEVLLACGEIGKVVVKKSTNANGGESIYFWENDNSKKSLEILKNILKKDYDFVIQECVKQHSEIAKRHPTSINTIRILTLNWHGEVRVLSAIIRMGANGSNVDNGHSGGVFCGIDEKGRLKNCAYNYMTGQKFENTHPTSGAVFSDSVIPNFDKCKDLVCKLAPRITSFSRLTSWDLSITEEGGTYPYRSKLGLWRSVFSPNSKRSCFWEYN